MITQIISSREIFNLGSFESLWFIHPQTDLHMVSSVQMRQQDLKEQLKQLQLKEVEHLKEQQLKESLNTPISPKST